MPLLLPPLLLPPLLPSSPSNTSDDGLGFSDSSPNSSSEDGERGFFTDEGLYSKSRFPDGRREIPSWMTSLTG